MKFKTLFFVTAALTAPLFASADERYAGGDISLLPEYEDASAIYLDPDGKPIDSLLPWLRAEGMNAMRVRLFVNPDRYKETHPSDYDPNACQDLEYITPLCQDIVKNGFGLMLDFHYSDTWADPAKQWTPIDWQGLTDEQLYQKIYDYTRSTLLSLKEAGVVPAFIQPGNEISYGMLWGSQDSKNPLKALAGSEANWERFCTLLRQAVKACREVCPDAKIILHTERVADPATLVNFYRQMDKYSVDYDIIGLSYYPYFHGPLSKLRSALDRLAADFPGRETMIVETGYPYQWEVPGTTVNTSGTWPYSYDGQAKFITDLITLLEEYPHADGLFWWWMEYNAFGTKLSGWYNAPLFDSRNGRATPALRALCSFAGDSGIEETEVGEDEDDGFWYDICGRRCAEPSEPGIYVRRGRKLLIP